MSQPKLCQVIIRTSDLLAELEYSRLLLEAFWSRVETFPINGLNEEQKHEFDNLFYLLKVYESQSDSALSALRENADDGYETVLQFGTWV
jgi:hypothetical protein